MKKILKSDFYTRPVLKVAPELLGKYLVCSACGTEQSYRITEVEAYDGPEDKACHAAKGRTKRTEVMFGPAGHWYVYLVYGMYDMLNIVTDEEGYPAAVLIRGVEGIQGPGKLTRDIGISRQLHGLLAHRANGLWVEDRGEAVLKRSIKRTPRIGVSYAGECALWPYRFLLKEK
jgi:DNA-3-methyladenine glycosylase